MSRVLKKKIAFRIENSLMSQLEELALRNGVKPGRKFTQIIILTLYEKEAFEYVINSKTRLFELKRDPTNKKASKLITTNIPWDYYQKMQEIAIYENCSIGFVASSFLLDYIDAHPETP